MEYQGKYKAFDPSTVRTYPLVGRPNRVKLSDLLHADAVLRQSIDFPEPLRTRIHAVVEEVVAHIQRGKPVAFFTGAHLIKNGLSPLLIDLIRRRLFCVIGTNGAAAIHDFELALIGETSETVPNALPKGEFGMAYEFAWLNECMSLGNQMKLGLGESLGRMICDPEFRSRILKVAGRKDSPSRFAHPDKSFLAAAYEADVPVTIHVGIGTDVIDQHPSFDGQAKGGTSGRDFLIFTERIKAFTSGGMFINVGSAVTAPEVLLKAVSMVASAGFSPGRIVTADFDIRPFHPDGMSNEDSPFYYWRDQKSIVTRIPQAFDGKGYYIEGNQTLTFPFFYQSLMVRLS